MLIFEGLSGSIDMAFHIDRRPIIGKVLIKLGKQLGGISERKNKNNKSVGKRSKRDL